ncbi:auxin-binding protein ABP20-like [Euphorbia lathyris]|uniref:auxin-binding protein ABP20-like n=1 Tax=Euphorbia lathyris TaxID=212925 RepID=UPI003313F605
MILPILFIILSFQSCSSYALVQDFCVADTSSAGPGGFNCKKPADVTVADFVFSGLATPANYTKLVKASFTPAFVDQLPGLNGLGVSIARFDLEVGGFFPMHSHPQATEVFVVTSGAVNAGFISSANVVYSQNLKAGDVFVVPPGLLHYVINAGQTPVLGYVTFSSQKPGIQLMDSALFGNGLPTDVLAKATFLDADQIKKLKGVFGGTN